MNGFPQIDRRRLLAAGTAGLGLLALPQATRAQAAVEIHLPTLAPETDAAILQAGGFRDVDLFFAALTWRGWVGRA